MCIVYKALLFDAGDARRIAPKNRYLPSIYKEVANFLCNLYLSWSQHGSRVGRDDHIILVDWRYPIPVFFVLAATGREIERLQLHAEWPGFSVSYQATIYAGNR